MFLAMMLVKTVQQDARYQYFSTIGPLLPTMTDSVRALNGLSNEHLVFGLYYLGTSLFAGLQRGGGGGLFDSSPLWAPQP